MRAVLEVRKVNKKKFKMDHIEGKSSLHTASDEPLQGSNSFRIARFKTKSCGRCVALQWLWTRVDESNG